MRRTSIVALLSADRLPSARRRNPGDGFFSPTPAAAAAAGACASWSNTAQVRRCQQTTNASQNTKICRVSEKTKIPRKRDAATAAERSGGYAESGGYRVGAPALPAVAASPRAAAAGVEGSRSQFVAVGCGVTELSIFPGSGVGGGIRWEAPRVLGGDEAVGRGRGSRALCCGGRDPGRYPPPTPTPLAALSTIQCVSFLERLWAHPSANNGAAPRRARRLNAPGYPAIVTLMQAYTRPRRRVMSSVAYRARRSPVHRTLRDEGRREKQGE